MRRRRNSLLVLGENWTPVKLDSKLVRWYKADAIAGLSDGGAVGQWNDSTGNSHATQSTADKKPTYKVGIVNGKPVVRFDGGDVLRASRAFTDDDFSVFVVYAGAAQNNNILFAQSTGSGSGLWQMNSSPFSPYNKLRVLFYNTDYRAVNGDSIGMDSTFHCFYTDTDGAGTTLLRVDGGAPEGTVTGQTFAPQNTGTSIGAGGSPGSESSFFTGDIAEIICCTPKLSDANRNLVERYLHKKYGIVFF